MRTSSLSFCEVLTLGTHPLSMTCDGLLSSALPLVGSSVCLRGLQTYQSKYHFDLTLIDKEVKNKCFIL